MPYPSVRGISSAYQHELIGVMEDLTATDGLDSEVERRARWLAMALSGRPHGQSESLPFVESGPLAPALAPERVPA